MARILARNPGRWQTSSIADQSRIEQPAGIAPPSGRLTVHKALPKPFSTGSPLSELAPREHYALCPHRKRDALLHSRPDGLGRTLTRRGYTRAAVDLARLGGLHASGVICEILNDDGAMARLPDLVRFCKMHELKMIAVADVERYRLAFDPRT